MNEEKIRNLLFKGKEISLKTIKTLSERGYLPTDFSVRAIKRWERTFIGQFVMSYPKETHKLLQVERAIGRKPEIFDFTEDNLSKVVTAIKADNAPNTAKLIASQVKTTITRVLELNDGSVSVPCKRYNKILSLDGTPTTKTYMNIDDVKAFLKYEPTTTMEKVCHARFAVMLMTGARYSDVCNFNKSNIQDGVLTFVPQKTKASGTVVSVPVSETTIRFIEILSEGRGKYALNQFNSTIRDICRKCGLNEEVTYFAAGKYVTKPKYEAMRSHLGRASFVTNMLKMGQQMHEVSKLAGHTDIAMTSRYNASTDVKLTEKANDFINMKF